MSSWLGSHIGAVIYLAFAPPTLSIMAWSTIVNIRRKYFTQPSEFAAGICRSLREQPHLWDYDNTECWLNSEESHLSISVQDHNFGRCNSYHLTNRGSLLLETLRDADLLAFRAAVRDWKEITAIERRITVERRKKDALAALAAAKHDNRFAGGSL